MTNIPINLIEPPEFLKIIAGHSIVDMERTNDGINLLLDDGRILMVIGFLAVARPQEETIH